MNEGRWKIEFCDLVNHDKTGLGTKLKILKFDPKAQLQPLLNCILIDCPCSLMHHIQFPFDGLKPQVFHNSFHYKS
jgi:hypothetical protein